MAYDKCITCANRVIASPECIGCNGEENYKPVEQTLQKPFESDSTKNDKFVK